MALFVYSEHVGKKKFKYQCHFDLPTSRSTDSPFQTWCLPTLAILTRLVSLPPPNPRPCLPLFPRSVTLTLWVGTRVHAPSPGAGYLTVADDERLVAWCTLGQTKANNTARAAALGSQDPRGRSVTNGTLGKGGNVYILGVSDEVCVCVRGRISLRGRDD